MGTNMGKTKNKSNKKETDKKQICIQIRNLLDLWLDEETEKTMLQQMKFQECLYNILNIFMMNNQIKEKYAKKDIEDYIRNICMFLKKNQKEITDKDIEDYVKKIFNEKKRNVTCFIPLQELEGFPEGYELGNSRISLFENLPKELKVRIEEEYGFRYKIRDDTENTLNLEDYKNIHISKHWIHRKLDGIGYYKLNDEMYEKISTDLNILRISCGEHASIALDHNEFFFFYPDTKFCIAQINRDSVFYTEVIGEDTKSLNELFSKDNKSDIDNRIIISLNIYALQTTITKIEVKFVLMISALEGLLLSDKDYIGKKLSEKVAFLIGKDKSERISVYDKMKTFYDKRSSFTHQNIRERNKITEPDFQYLSNIFVRTVGKILELERKKIIETIAKENKPNKPDKSLDSYIMDLMFSY